MPEYQNDIGDLFCGAYHVIEWSYRKRFSLLTTDGLYIVGADGITRESLYLDPEFDLSKIKNCRRCLLDPYRRCDLDQFTSDFEPQPNPVLCI